MAPNEDTRFVSVIHSDTALNDVAKHQPNVTATEDGLPQDVQKKESPLWRRILGTVWDRSVRYHTH